MKNNYENSIISVNKPIGISSQKAVWYVKKATGIKKVGHAGTLDPLASGVLVIGVGRGATKELWTHVKAEKEYIAEITLGKTSTTDDEEGEKTIVNVEKQPSKKEIKAVLKTFIGEIEQIPPVYSAIKIQGKEAYKYARKGEEVKMNPRKAFIKKIILIKYSYPNLKIKVITGKGVYIRSLARYIGEKLKTGAYMSGLARTRVGKFKIKNALSLEQFGY